MNHMEMMRLNHGKDVIFLEDDSRCLFFGQRFCEILWCCNGSTCPFGSPKGDRRREEKQSCPFLLFFSYSHMYIYILYIYIYTYTYTYTYTYYIYILYIHIFFFFSAVIIYTLFIYIYTHNGDISHQNPLKSTIFGRGDESGAELGAEHFARRSAGGRRDFATEWTGQCGTLANQNGI